GSIITELIQVLHQHGIQLILVRKSVKNINFRIKFDTERQASILHISCPRHASDKAITQALTARMDWILASHAKLAARFNQQPSYTTEHEFTQATLWGRPLDIAKYLWGNGGNGGGNDNRDGSDNRSDDGDNRRDNSGNNKGNSNDRLIIRNLSPSTLNTLTNTQRQAVLLAIYRHELNKALPILADKWQPIVGKHAQEIRLKNMTTRWGSCNTKDARVWLSVYLPAYPYECTEYVFVHELCHLHHANHRKAFWHKVAQAMPEYQKWHRLLKNQPL
ncbi:MAG: DUF45 domain-containing protein, partial [Moraxella sp.]|nr:DUF45 domain-containing protein [Moraxella sp.]